MPRARRSESPRFLYAGALAALLSACSPAPPFASSRPEGGAPQGAARAAARGDDLPEVAADPREKILSDISSVLLSEKHLLKRPIDDALSRETFPKYVEELDGAKLLLLEENVNALARYAERMDD